MAERAYQLPSTKEHLDLVALIPTQKPPTPSAGRVLYRLVDLCRTKWIRDFLFTPDPIHVPHFISPTFSNAAFICRHRITCAETPSPLMKNVPFGESTHVDGTTVMVPVFTAGGLTVGFGSVEGLVTVMSPWQLNCTSQADRANTRFVRDASKGALLMTRTVLEADHMEFRYSTLESTTSCHLAEVKLQRKRLLESMQGEGGLLSIRQLLSSLQCFKEEYLYRPCFVCSSLPSSSCDCSLPTNQPAHPFDMQFAVDDLSQYFGNFRSVASEVFILPGLQERHAVLGSHTSFERISDPGLLADVKQWTLTEHGKTLQEDPWQSRPLNRASSYHIGDTHCREERTDDNNARTYGLESIPDPSPTHIYNSTSIIPLYSHDAVREFEMEGGALGASITASRPSITGLRYRTDGIGEKHQDVPTQGQDVKQTETRGDNSVERAEQGIIAGVDCSVTNGGGNVEGETVGGRAKNCSISEAPRDELRIRRNRESARRCNERNRLKREGLKLELKKFSEKVAVLRGKEMELRKENLLLRKLLHQTRN